MATIGAGTRPDVTLKLSQLQNLCKRDPVGYRNEYDAQVRRLKSECHILSLSPSSRPPPQLSELIQFAAAVSSSSYNEQESKSVSTLLTCLLLGTSHEDNENAALNYSENKSLTLPASALAMHRDVRKSCVSALILMRNKGRLPPLQLLELFFRLMAIVPDKGLREQLYRHVLNDIRNINKKGKKNDEVNRKTQSFLHRVISSTVRKQKTGVEVDDATKVAAKRAVDMTSELYRRKVWTEQRTVAILASATESILPNVAAAAMRFFLGIEDRMADDKDREEQDAWHGVQQIDFHLHSKKTKKREKQVGKQVLKKLKQQQKREKDEDTNDYGVEASRKLYPAIELLRDPQGLAESVLKRIQTTGANGFRFEHKLLAINFVTRLVGNHELILLSLYPFMRRYLDGNQRDVTQILAYCVQSCHDTVPPEEIHSLLKTISHNFITERCSGEQIAVGINACRSICARAPSCLAEDDSMESSSVTVDPEAFARDLSGYAKHRDRSVAVAGRSWTNFIRMTHPSLLQGKDRGRAGAALHRAGEKPLRYGEQRVSAGVEGADLLVEYESKKAAYLKEREERGDVSSEDDSGSEMEEDIQEDDDEADESDDEKAPRLVPVKIVNGKIVPDTEEGVEGNTLDLSKMTRKERAALRQDISSNRVFSTSDFEKMRKLVDREERIKRDPRAAARLKRRRAQGKEFEELSDDDSDIDSDEEDRIHTKGAVNASDIMAESKRKRANKIERLEKIVAGRSKFEHNTREGGSTNTEKKRKKNFLMTKFSFANRTKQGSKETARRGTLKKTKQHAQNKHEGKKRRRKM